MIARRRVPRLGGVAAVLGYLLLSAVTFPKILDVGIVPYVEMARNEVRRELAAEKQRSGRYPEDVRPLLRAAVAGLKLSPSRAACIEACPFHYDPATGAFSLFPTARRY